MSIVSEVGRILIESEHIPEAEVRSPATTVYVAIHTPSHGGITDEDIDIARRLDHGLRDYILPADLLGGKDAPGVEDELGSPDAPGVPRVLPSDPEAPPGLRPRRTDT